MKYDIIPPAKAGKSTRSHKAAMAGVRVPVVEAYQPQREAAEQAALGQAAKPIRRRRRNYARLIQNDSFIFNV